MVHFKPIKKWPKIAKFAHNGTYQFLRVQNKNQYKTHKNFSNSAIYGGIETFDIKAKTRIDIEKFFLVFFSALRKSQRRAIII